MREILFRGKRKDNGEWIQGDLRHWNNGVGIHSDILHHTIKVDPETVGQFTGLRDKNETRIFEGDILKCVYSGYVAAVEAEVWNCSCCHPVFGFSTKTSNPGISDTVEVIGNIHDNHELLKEGEDNG